MTKKQAVYNVLKSRRWTPGWELTAPDVGGSEGLRRLRELRADGFEIRSRRIEGSTAFEYRLVGRV
jgi:hypothetical protein